MDPLSDILSLMKPRSYVSGGFNVGGPWSVQFPRHDGIKCYAIVLGGCWLAVEGEAAPVRLAEGDCFLMPSGRPFRLASDLALEPEDVMAYPRKSPGIQMINGGGDCCVVGGHFSISHASLLLGMLPPIVHVREEADKIALRWSMKLMMQELSEQRPGGVLMAQHLAHMILVQALRAHLAERPKGGVGWLFALADRQMGAAISAMHADPAQRWTLQALAERAGMSRSSFAARFKETVGASPMDYLTRWRMLLAAERLAVASEPVSAIALSLGYESESAFSTAFKRVMGASPRRHARSQPTEPANRELRLASVA
ncbi:MAG TPA: AraC family transcriptional regulator [Caulobacteraceae bacterium]|nr:AraC family transcriptional regulator [Caulobacteraceae bacterium]